MNNPRETPVSEEVISIKGMHCKSCVELIESEIGFLEEVKNIKVDLIKNNAVVQFDPNIINLEKIKTEINSLGYSTSIPTGDTDVKKNNFLQGLVYGLVPHTGCIAFITASIVGATAAMNLFKPLLMTPYFFHILVLLSLVFATISTIVYLRRNNILSLSGIKRKWRYFSIMYSSTIGINILFFMVVFPLLANASLSSTAQSAFTDYGNFASLQLRVDIPCPGHAPLISEELKSVHGVVKIRFSYPNIFDVAYDSTETTKEEMLSLEVFTIYKATVLNESLPPDSPDQKSDTQSHIGSQEGNRSIRGRN